MTQWLSDDEQQSWRAFIAVLSLLPDRLGRDLGADSGLSMADYDILVRLSDQPDRRIRMSDLADQTLSSRSRLSHQIDRMVKAGLVERESCDTDRRGMFAVLTEHGYDALVAAAPAHVASVRNHLVDVLGAEEFAALGRISATLRDHLEESETAEPGTANVSSDGRG